VFIEAPLWNALAEVTLHKGRPDLASDYARRAIAVADPHASSSTSLNDPSQASPLSLRHEREVASGHLIHSEIDQHHYRDALIVWQQYLARDSELTGGCKRSVNLAPLDPGVVAITIAPIDERLAIWTRTSTSLKFHWSTATPEDYLRDIRKLRRLAMTAATTGSDISAAAKTVAGILFEDVPPPTAIYKLRIEARGEFASFPLEIVSDARPGPVVEDAAFVPLPGVCSGVCQANKTGGTVIAASRIDPRFERILPSLGELETETRDISRHLPDTTVFSGSAATPTVISNRAALSGNFHFSGHAIRWRHGIGLVMSPDQTSSDPDAKAGIWTVRPGTPFCANLAFLSACSTGAYEESETILPGDLAEAALGAGAHRVIVALWDIDSQATREFVSRFYDSLNKGASPEVASHAAANAVKAQRTYAHPYFWAPFVVFESDKSGE
jgi:CHAT domain-containing protein